MCADMVPPLARVTIAGEYDADGVPACGHFAGRQTDGEQLSGDEFRLAEVVNVQW
jgi:hypothetical protein